MTPEAIRRFGLPDEFPAQRATSVPVSSAAMKLYVCWGTFPTPRPGGHPCANAYKALRAAGHDPQVVHSYGLTILPDAIANRSAGRQAARRLTGKSTVPVLELDDGSAIADSRRIVDWAQAHPAR